MQIGAIHLIQKAPPDDMLLKVRQEGMALSQQEQDQITDMLQQYSKEFIDNQLTDDMFLQTENPIKSQFLGVTIRFLKCLFKDCASEDLKYDQQIADQQKKDKQKEKSEKNKQMITIEKAKPKQDEPKSIKVQTQNSTTHSIAPQANVKIRKTT